MKKTISIILMIIIMMGILIPNQSNAVNITQAELYSKGLYAGLLKYNNIIIETTYVVYQKDGVEYPAYCLQNNLQGVGEQGAYTVSVDKLLSDVMVWRAITNGYPYKTYEELGCQNKEEAYVATKQAVYCIIYNRDGSEYSGIGEAGTRTVNALRQIIAAARASSSSKVSSDITIEEDNIAWTIDSVNSSCLSKTFSIKTNGSTNEYSVSLEGTLPEGTNLVDLNNNAKNKFANSEKFKIIMPIRNILNVR